MQEKVEDHYWACDGLNQQYVDQFIIHFGDGDSDSDDENNTSSSSECDGSTDDECSTTSDQGGFSDKDDASVVSISLDTPWNELLPVGNSTYILFCPLM